MNILEENKRRLRIFNKYKEYDPLRGIGACGPRVSVATPVKGMENALIPESMANDPHYPAVRNNAAAWTQLRFRHDFEFWAASCVNIFYKEVGRKGPLILNPGQRHVLNTLEEQRRGGKPVRVIILKARQWGATTLISTYMAWIQMVLSTNCNSIFCGHNKDAAINIRGMLEHLMAEYPAEHWDTDLSPKPEMRPFAGSPNIREIRGRDCRVTLATAETPDAVRGANIALAHLTEVAYYPNSAMHTPENLMKAIVGSVANAAGTVIAMESTANGVGNYFHREWQRAVASRSDKAPIFVPWSMIPQYYHEVDDAKAQEFYDSFDDYERELWDKRQLTLQQIMWHRDTLRSYPSAETFHAEYPIDDKEAFSLSGCSVFHPDKVEELSQTVVDPVFVGDLSESDTLQADPLGKLAIWEKPDKNTEYVAAMDIGGRTEDADWSVIAVLTVGEHPRVVAQWRGHMDHDLLADKAMQIGRYYNDALLVVESNTIETGENGIAIDYSLPIMERMQEYPRIYCRKNMDMLSGIVSYKPGFHTNRRTKHLLITKLIAAVRDMGYTERDRQACLELLTYAQLPNGNYAARQGCHDDILMTRALALYAMPDPEETIDPATVP